MSVFRLAVATMAAITGIGLGGAAQAYTVYISNEKGNSLTVIDSDTLEVQTTIPVGQRPRGIMLTKDDKKVLICASDSDTVQVLDVASRKIVADLPSGPDPELLNIHPSGSPVYVANEDDSMLTVIDLETKKVLAEVPVGVEPEGVGMSPDGKVVVVTSETTNMAHFIDTETNEIFDNVLVGQRPRFADFTADGAQLWVTSEVAGTTTVIDAATRKILKVIEFSVPGVQPEYIQPVGVRISKDGSTETWASRFNEELMSGIEMGKVEEITYQGAEGKDIQAYVVLPPGFDPEKKWPLVSVLHGGPHGITGE